MMDYYYYDQIWAIGNQFSGGMDTDRPCYKANIPYDAHLVTSQRF